MNVFIWYLCPAFFTTCYIFFDEGYLFDVHLAIQGHDNAHGNKTEDIECCNLELTAFFCKLNKKSQVFFIVIPEECNACSSREYIYNNSFAGEIRLHITHTLCMLNKKYLPPLLGFLLLIEGLKKPGNANNSTLLFYFCFTAQEEMRKYVSQNTVPKWVAE